jgi:hypothetical protein
MYGNFLSGSSLCPPFASLYDIYLSNVTIVGPLTTVVLKSKTIYEGCFLLSCLPFNSISTFFLDSSHGHSVMFLY